MFVTNNIPARPMEGERERREMVSGMRKFGAQAGKHHRALGRSQETSRAWVVLTHYRLVGPQYDPGHILLLIKPFCFPDITAQVQRTR